MKLFSLLIFIFSSYSNCQAGESVELIETLKSTFFKTVKYELTKEPENYSASQQDKISPIPLDSSYRKIFETNWTSEDFKSNEWFFKHKDHYEEASYMWYQKLQENQQFNFKNFREYYWCLISTNRYPEIINLSIEILAKLKVV